MAKLPPDSRALQQTIYVGLISFVVGFVGMLSLLSWVIVRFVVPESRWWHVLHMSIESIMLSIVVGGLGFMALSVSLLNWYHYKRGFYRCRFCGKALKSFRIACGCPKSEAWKHNV